jgi:hypothetical protein
MSNSFLQEITLNFLTVAAEGELQRSDQGSDQGTDRDTMGCVDAGLLPGGEKCKLRFYVVE